MPSKPGSDTRRRPPKFITGASIDPHLTSTAPQIAFANEVVAAMKNRMTEGRALAGMRQGELS
jgi:hypothetical protein